MRETKSKEIGGHIYQVTQLGALEGRKVLARLAKALAPLAAPGEISARIGAVVAGLKEEDIEQLCDTFAKHTCVTGGEYGSKAPPLGPIFDAHFVAKYEDLVQWLVFSLRVNFEGFFQGLGAKLGDSPAASPSA
jgi:hypothetical protein